MLGKRNICYVSHSLTPFIFTHDDDSRGREAFVGLFSVRLFVRSITQKNDPKVFKLSIGNDLRISCKRYGFRSKGQRSRSQGHNVKNILKVIEWPA